MPCAGGIASLIDDYIPKQKEKRVIDFTQKLSERLSAVDNKINKNFIKTEEFAFLFEQCYRSVLEKYHEETLSALRGVLINSTIRFDVTQDEKEEFIRIAGLLRPTHLQILKHINNTKGGSVRNIDDLIYIVTKSILPKIDSSSAKALVVYLQSIGLLQDPAIERDPACEAHRYTPIDKEKYPPIYPINLCLTRFGNKFLEFIKDPKVNK